MANNNDGFFSPLMGCILQESEHSHPCLLFALPRQTLLEHFRHLYRKAERFPKNFGRLSGTVEM